MLIFQLSNFGIGPDCVTWSRVALTTDKWMAVRHSSNGHDSQVSLMGYCIDWINLTPKWLA